MAGPLWPHASTKFPYPWGSGHCGSGPGPGGIKPGPPCREAPTPPIAIALMNIAPKSSFVLSHRHLLGIQGLSSEDIAGLLDLAEEFVELNHQIEKKRTSLRGRTQINLFFEASTRTQSSFELAGKRLGADVMNMSVGVSAMRKGETLLDTAITLNAMRPDILVVRHHASGAFVPSVQEYFHYYGLDQKKLGYAKPDALVMHPGPMNRGVEIDSSVADGAQSLIREQVEMGVAVRMAVLEALSRNLPNA